MSSSSSEKSMKSPEKSSFAQTCSLLSQYLKEGGSFGNRSLGITCNIEATGASEMPRLSTTTMNLFPRIERSGDVFARAASPPPRNLESMNLFPQQAGFAPPSMADSRLNKPVSGTVEPPPPQAAQMTIFYGGQVIMFNDFPADKAKEIMLLASMGSSNGHTTTFPSKSPPIEPNCRIPSFGNNSIPEQVQVQPPLRPVSCDLPIARRNSLQRFLEKRKDRIIARAPYQASSPSWASAASAAPKKSKSWLGLAAQLDSER